MNPFLRHDARLDIGHFLDDLKVAVISPVGSR